MKNDIDHNMTIALGLDKIGIYLKWNYRKLVAAQYKYFYPKKCISNMPKSKASSDQPCFEYSLN